MFLNGLIVGLFIGAMVGFVVSSMCTVASRGEEYEKQIPIEPHEYIQLDGTKKDICPRCYDEDRKKQSLHIGQKYCWECGQRIKWK